jgi:hypothetical protein
MVNRDPQRVARIGSGSLAGRRGSRLLAGLAESAVRPELVIRWGYLGAVATRRRYRLPLKEQPAAHWTEHRALGASTGSRSPVSESPAPADRFAPSDAPGN